MIIITCRLLWGEVWGLRSVLEPCFNDKKFVFLSQLSGTNFVHPCVKICLVFNDLHNHCYSWGLFMQIKFNLNYSNQRQLADSLRHMCVVAFICGVGNCGKMERDA